MKAEDRTTLPLPPIAAAARKPWRRPQLRPLHNVETEGGMPNEGGKWLLNDSEEDEEMLYRPEGTYSGGPS